MHMFLKYCVVCILCVVCCILCAVFWVLSVNCMHECVAHACVCVLGVCVVYTVYICSEVCIYLVDWLT